MELEDKLMNLLMARKNPNCTLYLIWHYVKEGQIEYARTEFVRDSDKLGVVRSEVSKLLEIIY